jgi:CRP/FNR family transcriptional regulator, cyclic AMP receptor protein
MTGPSAAGVASAARRPSASRWWAEGTVSEPAPRRDVDGAVIASGIFRKTDPGRVHALVERLRPVRFPAGHVVFAQGDPGGALFMITSGKVKVTYRHTDGREAVLNVLGTSDVFGEVTPFDCGPREVTATTMTEVCAVPIERQQLLRWMVDFPEVIHQIGRLLARRADVMTEYLTHLSCADPTYRVARRLLLLSKRFGYQEGDVVRVVHDLTLKEISLFAGVPSEMVAATLDDFADRGLIRFEDDTLVIVDGHGLASLSSGAGRG